MPARYRETESTLQWRKVSRTIFVAATVFYIGFHALSGERGLYALVKESRKLALLQAELEEVAAKRTVLDRRVRLLSSNSLDLDLLDETSRQELGYSTQGEKVVILPQVQQ